VYKLLHKGCSPELYSHCVKVLQLHQDWIWWAIPSFDGHLILTCSDGHICLADLLCDVSNYATAQTAKVTDLESASIKAKMQGHNNVVEVAVFVPSISVPAVCNLVALVSVDLSLLHVYSSDLLLILTACECPKL
jgi:hypothetical protein